MSDALEKVKEELKNAANNSGKEEKKEEDSIEVIIKENEMKAYLFIPSIEEKEIDKAYLLEKLNKKGVVYGISEEMLDSIVENNIRDAEVQVAQGKDKTDGIDGYITYYFEPNPVRKPALLEDGSVDYKNLGIIQNVEANQLLAENVLPVEGEDGMNVKGRRIPAHKGKKCILKKGKNVRLSEDELSIISEIEGNVELINGAVCVSNIRTISGDVGNATGNIYYKGDILILGNVLAGFSVEAVGSITIEGFVEASIVKAGGDILIKKGIQGAQKGKIISGGDISSKFIEMAEVRSKGSIYTNAVINSEIESEQDIIIKGRKGYIIGGYTKALNKVEVTGLGNKWEARTIIEVGFIDKNNQRLIELMKRVDAIEEELKDIDKITQSKGKKYKGRLVNSLDLMRIKIEKMAEKKSCINEADKLTALKEKCGICKVEVENTVNLGVEIYMGNDVYRPKSAIKAIKLIKGSNNNIVTYGL